MNVVNWSPFYEMDDLFSRYRDYLSATGKNDAVSASRDWRPVADISETESEYLIKAQLPDVDRKDVHVSVDNGRITISGERSMEEEEHDATQHRIESFYGTFSRSFALPNDADEDKISAKAKNGILRVRVPKTKASEPTPLEISVE